MSKISVWANTSFWTEHRLNCREHLYYSQTDTPDRNDFFHDTYVMGSPLVRRPEREHLVPL